MSTQASQRERRVLAALVQMYIARREPISSRMLEDGADLGVKSASIRSVLSELERSGFLSQPHSHAGRVPTDEGYRAYVDDLLRAEFQLEEQEAREIHRALREAGEDLHEILRAMARTLGRFSANIAILAGPGTAGAKITGIDMYDRGGNKALVAVTLDVGSVRTELVDLSREVPPHMLSAASVFLAERLAGRPLEETRVELETLLEGSLEDAPGVAQDVARHARSLFEPEEVLQLTFEGITEALEQPEFGDPERLKSLLEVVSRAQDFERALDSFIDQGPGEVALAIGRENPLQSLHPFSLAATRFEVSGLYGYLAVLGPRRMQYARTLSLIRAIGVYLDRLS